MDVLGALAHVLGDVTEEGDDVVLGDLFDLADAVDVEGGLVLDLRHRLGGDLAQPAQASQTANSTSSQVAMRASSVQRAAISGVE